MKKTTPPFATQYPYLNYWINDWGYMQIGHDEDNPYDSFIMLLDMGGTCYEGDAENTLDEALQKAEKYLREVESQRFNKATKEALEDDYRNFGL